MWKLLKRKKSKAIGQVTFCGLFSLSVVFQDWKYILEDNFENVSAQLILEDNFENVSAQLILEDNFENVSAQLI